MNSIPSDELCENDRLNENKLCKFEQNQSVVFVEQFDEYPFQQGIFVHVVHCVEQGTIHWQYGLDERKNHARIVLDENLLRYGWNKDGFHGQQGDSIAIVTQCKQDLIREQLIQFTG